MTSRELALSSALHALATPCGSCPSLACSCVRALPPVCAPCSRPARRRPLTPRLPPAHSSSSALSVNGGSSSGPPPGIQAAHVPPPPTLPSRRLVQIVGSTIVQQAGLSVNNAQQGILPHGWLEYIDESSDRPYYYNVRARIAGGAETCSCGRSGWRPQDTTRASLVKMGVSATSAVDRYRMGAMKYPGRGTRRRAN
jgi:hypothetical protein